MVYSLNSKGVAVTDLGTGETLTMPLDKPLAATVNPLLGILFYATKQGIFKRSLFHPGPVTTINCLKMLYIYK